MTCSTEVLSFAHLGRNWKYPAIWFAVYLGWCVCWFISENFCDECGEVETPALLMHFIMCHSTRVPRSLEYNITINHHKSIYKKYKMGSWRPFERSRGRKTLVFLGLLFCNIRSDLRYVSILLVLHKVWSWNILELAGRWIPASLRTRVPILILEYPWIWLLKMSW